MEIVISLRNAIIGLLYRNLLKPILFQFDPEDVHDRITAVGTFLGKYRVLRAINRLFFGYKNSLLEQTILGIHFENPIGLSAGFDKNAVLTDITPEVGFGFEEIGSITAESCEGNPRPRLHRLPKSKSLVVYYGLKNDGAQKIHERLKNKTFEFPIGVSIAKTNCTRTVETREGIADYIEGMKTMRDIGDYMTINISCPNTHGGEPFTDVENLEKLLTEVDKLNIKKPIFLKISPDISRENLDAIIENVTHHNIQGFVCTNLTKNRNNPKIKDGQVPENGGLSGKIVEDLANEMIAYVYKKTHGKYVIIGSGGVFTAEDAYKKIRLGASLIQMITGMIYNGPQTISEINQGLVKLLKRDGYKTITEAIGRQTS